MLQSSFKLTFCRIKIKLNEANDVGCCFNSIIEIIHKSYDSNINQCPQHALCPVYKFQSSNK